MTGLWIITALLVVPIGWLAVELGDWALRRIDKSEDKRA